ncbi:MAG: beta-mannosidase [Anaerolineae bacterium]
MNKVSRPSEALFREAGTGDAWAPARLPGSVHTDLMALGRIPDPFVADNELEVQWVAERDWEYRVHFRPDEGLLAEERIFLVCDGLDTLSDVRFNDQFLGHTENMFRQYRWNVTDLITKGQNEVHLLFSSTVNYMLDKQEEEPLIGPSQSIPGGAHVRKAPSQFGWDWGPQLPPMGIWREIRLEGYTTARLNDVHLRQIHRLEGVTLRVGVAVERWRSADLEARVQVTAPTGEVQACRISLDGVDTEGREEIDIKDPQLWWPNGYGPQPLYQVHVSLYEGEILRDERDLQIGLRKLELLQEQDDFGTSFTFVVNDVPIFAKGANWIPADSFPTRLTAARLEHLIRSAAEANMNMLRVWGGGLYEDDLFYDLCDQYGLLIWQDFIFSCSVYPADEAFLDDVRDEIIYNIRRLRHHPSMALWCGNNEMEWGWVGWGWAERTGPEYKTYYDQMFHHMLPELCETYDPDTPYWPSSPSSGIPFEDPGGVRAGDTHNWEVWHGGAPFEQYRDHPSRFVSEFGFQSLPPLDTVRTYAAEADWNMTSYIMEHHQRNASGNGKIITYMTAHFRMPKDFPSLIYLSQLLQAEAVRTGVEFWRRNPSTSGALYWQLNDCWPVASWASLDYYGRWKALHYAARRFFAPLLLSAEKRNYREGSATTTHATGYLFQPEPGPFVDLFLTSDLLEPWEGTVLWSLETLDGDVLQAGRQQVAPGALSADKIISLDFEDRVDPTNERSVVLVYELTGDDERQSLGVLPFVPSKHLELSDPELSATVRETAWGFEIEITAQKLARFVWLTVEQADESFGAFSDNFFDLPAGRSTTVTLPTLDGWDVERLEAALRIRSLVDSY